MKTTLIFLFSFFNFLILNVHSQVVQQWAKSYNYSANADDNSNDIKADSDGNLYVLGNSIYNNNAYFTLIKYSPQGNVLWSANFSVPGSEGLVSASSLALDGAAIYVSGQLDGKIVVLKYSLTGTMQWLRYYSEPGIDSAGYSARIMVSSSGSLYVSATYGHTGNIVLLKYDPSGTLLFARKFNGSDSKYNFAGVLLEDQLGNIYMAGRSGATINTTDVIIIKFDNGGNPVWFKKHHSGAYPGPGPRIALDAAGNVYLAYSSMNESLILVIKLVKYDPAGSMLWQVSDSGDAPGDSEAWSVAAGMDGNIYVTGSNFNNTTNTDCVTLKFSSSGNLIWKKTFDGGIQNVDIGYRLIIGPDGNLYIGGSTNSTTGYYDYLALKYSSLGELMWHKSYNGSGSSTDIINAMTLDNSGNLVVTGWSIGSGTGSDMTTVKYAQPIGISPVSNEVPKSFSLSQNYPNPFNPETKIKFQIPAGSSAAQIFLSVSDILGREVAVLVKQNLQPGTYEVNWNASNFPSGVYFFTLKSGSFTETGKMLLIK
mgnify:CR=1 FL=1